MIIWPANPRPTILRKSSALADADVARKYASYGTLRMMVWAIPFVGSLGTVVGFGPGGGQSGAGKHGRPHRRPHTRPGRGLGQARAWALAMAVVLMLGQFACDQIESRLLLAVDVRASRELIGRFKGGTARYKGAVAAGPTGNLGEAFRDAISQLIGAKTNSGRPAWKPTRSSGRNKPRHSRNSSAPSKVAAERGGGFGGGGAAGGLPADAAGWQEALMRNAGFAAVQQAEMAIQAEIMQQLVEVISQQSANWPVRRSRLFKSGQGNAADSDAWLADPTP